MNKPRFMAHIQFQQRATDYRAGMRDVGRLEGQIHAYPDEAEEIQNDMTWRQLTPLVRATDRMCSELVNTQQHALTRLGLVVKL